jgi:hypothetical protein
MLITPITNRCEKLKQNEEQNLDYGTEMLVKKTQEMSVVFFSK